MSLIYISIREYCYLIFITALVKVFLEQIKKLKDISYAYEFIKRNNYNLKSLVINAFYHLNHCLGRKNSAENNDMVLEDVKNHLLGNDDTSNKAKNSEESDNQAKKISRKKTPKAVTVDQESGKIYLANILVYDYKVEEKHNKSNLGFLSISSNRNKRNS